MEKLTAIQTELKVPKGQFNSFGKYNYRSCEDIMEAIKPALKKHKCSLIITDDVVEIGGRIYVKATVKLADGENIVTVSAWAREAENKKGMDEAQITGAASSYARKYALAGMFLLDDTKDADATNGGGNGAAKTEQPKPKKELKEGTEDFKKAIDWMVKSSSNTVERLRRTAIISEKVEKSLRAAVDAQKQSVTI